MSAPAAPPRRAVPRRPGRVVLLGLLTLGAYFAWYYFEAFREVAWAERERHGGLIFLGLVPFVGPLFALVYVQRELERLARARQRLGLAPSLSPAQHFWRAVLGLFPATVASLVLLGTVGADLDGFEPAWLVAAVLAAWWPVATVPRLAKDVNGYWLALAGRASQAPAASGSK